MFVFSLGLGTLLLLVGTFAGLTAHLPKSGPWLKAIKIVFALILLGASEYFLIQAGLALF
jgi:thiol:disulfide interchange protein DsbD